MIGNRVKLVLVAASVAAWVYFSRGHINMTIHRKVMETSTETKAVPLNHPLRRAEPTAPLSLTPLSDCTEKEIRKRPGVMVLTTTNMGYLDILLNLLESIKRTRVCPNITIIAKDKDSHAYLLRRTNGQRGLNVLQSNSGYTNSSKLMVRTKEYINFVNEREQYLLNFLEKGFEVLFTDSDTFWFRDPFPFFEGNFDIAMLDELLNYPKVLNASTRFCDGFAYFKPTERTLPFVRRWVEVMKEDTKEKKTPDQNVMNDLYHQDDPVHLNVRSLDPQYFPKGRLFYNDKWRGRFNNTVAMHSSGILGHDAKVDHYKEHNMWLTDYRG